MPEGRTRPALPKRRDAARYSGLEFLARGAQQQAERERAGQGKAKDRGVAVRMHGSTIAEISGAWQTPMFVIPVWRRSRPRPPGSVRRSASLALPSRIESERRLRNSGSAPTSDLAIGSPQTVLGD